MFQKFFLVGRDISENLAFTLKQISEKVIKKQLKKEITRFFSYWSSKKRVFE